MKITFPLTLAVVAVPTAILVDGYYVGGCRPFRATSRYSSPKERNEYLRIKQERMNRAYQELQEDLERQKQDDQSTASDAFKYGENSPDSFRMDDEAIRKQREWVGRAFDIASEFNADFSSTKEEAKKNDEFIRKSQGWIDRMYGVDGPDEKTSVSFQPRYEIRSTGDKFEVAVDVPGVARDDIDISLEKDGKVLIVQGERKVSATNIEGEEEEKAQFLQEFDLDDNVDAEKISAKLDMGVLVIVAPKKVKEEKDDGRKSIPIM